jgi:LPS-assembly protein
LKTGYSITKESYNHSRVAGVSGDVVLTKDFNDRWAAYAGYHYSKKNRDNSLFKFNTDDYSKKLESGFSYRVDDLNRIAVGTKYDLDHKKWKNIDYYWYHDLHCSQLIFRYKSLDNGISVRWQFTPW